MRISESCAKCLYDKQQNKTDNEEYLAKIKELLDNRREEDTSPYMDMRNSSAKQLTIKRLRKNTTIWFSVWKMI